MSFPERKVASRTFRPMACCVAIDFLVTVAARLNMRDVFRADKGVVFTAVSTNGYALTYASAELRTDKDVVLKTGSQEG